MIPRWMLWTMAAVGCWGLWAVASRLIGEALSATHSQALSTIGILPVMAILAARHPVRPLFHGAGGFLALGAGVLTCLGNAAYYSLLNRGVKAATVVPLTALYPLVTVALAVLLLRERLGRIQLAGVAGSLVAIWLFNIPTVQGVSPVSLSWILAPIVLWGVSGLLQKLATNRVAGEPATLAFLAAFLPVAVVIVALEPLPAGVAGKTWAAVAALGLFFAAGNFALLAAFAAGGKASVVAPLAGLYPLVSVPIALIVFQETLGWREGAGIVIALIAVVALAIEPPATTTQARNP